MRYKMRRHVFINSSQIAFSHVNIIVFVKLLSEIPMHFLIDVSVIKVSTAHFYIFTSYFLRLVILIVFNVLAAD